jgi:SAM-dependent methyltransferase
MTVDFGKSALDYVAYRPDFHPRLFDRLRSYGIGVPGQLVLDVGAGTGLLGRGLAAGGARVVESDPSWELLAHASERLILRYRPGWRHAGGVGINGQALKDAQVAGFVEIESFSFDVEIPFERSAWHGFVRTCSAVAPSLGADALARFDAEHAGMLAADWPERVTVPHRVFAAVARRA